MELLGRLITSMGPRRAGPGAVVAGDTKVVEQAAGRAVHHRDGAGVVPRLEVGPSARARDVVLVSAGGRSRRGHPQRPGGP